VTDGIGNLAHKHFLFTSVLLQGFCSCNSTLIVLRGYTSSRLRVYHFRNRGMAFLSKKVFQRFRAPLSRLMSSSPMPLLLSPTQLHDLLLSKNDVSILDASWFMPNSPRKPGSEFLSKRIPGALFLDLDQVASPHELGLKHMMPKERVFADACGMPACLCAPLEIFVTSNGKYREFWH
jgi:hypothetical protein